MLKRFYSKRSGFTLVEIIVAFAVFAIMASMIAQILSLSVSARNSNNLYARELARQERLLTVIEKDSSYFDSTGDLPEYVIKLTDGDSYNLRYQTMAVDPDAENQAEGINYFISDVDYQYTRAGATDAMSDASDSSGSSGMSQTSRMDTRITGTSGLGEITVLHVIKDEYDYPDDSPFKLAEGHTRYLIEVSASGQITTQEGGTTKTTTTLKEEDVPYAQFRMYFYSDQLDAAKSSVQYTDSSGKKYTKDIYKEATIVDYGLINANITGALSVQEKGLSDSNTSSGSTISRAYNMFLIQQSGTNGIRIGPSFDDVWRFGDSTGGCSDITRFYVEFEGDPNLTAESFGANGVVDSDGSVTYTACPNYEETFNADGTPKYEKPADGSVHPSIYGGYLSTRHYISDSE